MYCFNRWLKKWIFQNFTSGDNLPRSLQTTAAATNTWKRFRLASSSSSSLQWMYPKQQQLVSLDWGTKNDRRRYIGSSIYTYNDLGQRKSRYTFTKEKARDLLDVQRWPLGSFCRNPQLQYNTVVAVITKLKRKRGLDVESMNLCIRLVERIIPEIAIPRQDRPSKKARMMKWATDLKFFGGIWNSWKVLWYKTTTTTSPNDDNKQQQQPDEKESAMLIQPLELQDLMVRMNHTLPCFRYNSNAMEQIMDVMFLQQQVENRQGIPLILENILDSMIHRADLLYDPDLKPRTDAYNLVLHAYAISGRTDAEAKMQQIMNKMQTEHIDPQIPNCITDHIWLRFYANDERQQQQQQQQRPSLDLDKLERFLDQLEKNHHRNIELRREQPSRKLLPHGLFGYYHRRGPIEKEIPIQKYHDLLEAWSASGIPGEYDRMMEIVTYMQDVAPGEWNIAPNMETYTILLRYWKDRSNLEQVQAIRERTTLLNMSWNLEFCTELLEFYLQLHHLSHSQQQQQPPKLLVTISTCDSPVSIPYLIKEMQKLVRMRSPRRKKKSKKKSGKHPHDNPKPTKITRHTMPEVEAIDYYQGWTILDTAVSIVKQYFEILDQQSHREKNDDVDVCRKMDVWMALVHRCLRYANILFDQMREQGFVQRIGMDDRMCLAVAELYALALRQLACIEGTQPPWSIILETSIGADSDKISLLIRALGLIIGDVESAENVFQVHVDRSEQRICEQISAFEAIVEVYASETLQKDQASYKRARNVFEVLDFYSNEQGEKLYPSVSMIENFSNIYQASAHHRVNQLTHVSVVRNEMDSNLVLESADAAKPNDTRVTRCHDYDGGFDYGSLFLPAN